MVDAMWFGVDQNVDVCQEEYIPGYPCKDKGQARNDDWRLPLDDSNRFAEMIIRAIRGGLVDRDLEDIHRSIFTPNIKRARNPPEFKIPTLRTLLFI